MAGDHRGHQAGSNLVEKDFGFFRFKEISNFARMFEGAEAFVGLKTREAKKKEMEMFWGFGFCV